jgi:hypothetical protein
VIVIIEKLRGRNVDLLNDLDLEANLVDVIDRMRGHSKRTTVIPAHRGDDMPEVNNIPPSLSYRPADPAEPVLDISIGDALRAATSTWRTRTALIDGTSEEQTHRRWTFEELLTETEKVARALLLRFVSGEHVAIWAAKWPGMGDD